MNIYFSIYAAQSGEIIIHEILLARSTTSVALKYITVSEWYHEGGQRKACTVFILIYYFMSLIDKLREITWPRGFRNPGVISAYLIHHYFQSSPMTHVLETEFALASCPPPDMLNYVTVMNRASLDNWILQKFPRLLHFACIFEGSMCERTDILMPYFCLHWEISTGC